DWWDKFVLWLTPEAEGGTGGLGNALARTADGIEQGINALDAIRLTRLFGIYGFAPDDFPRRAREARASSVSRASFAPVAIVCSTVRASAVPIRSRISTARSVRSRSLLRIALEAALFKSPSIRWRTSRDGFCSSALRKAGRARSPSCSNC